MRSKRSSELAGINSMAELKMAQNNISRELDMRKRSLTNDYQTLSRIFSVDYQLSRAVDRMAELRNHALNILHGFSFASKLVNKWRAYAHKSEARMTTEPQSATTVYEEDSDYDSNDMIEHASTSPTAAKTDQE